MAETMSRIRKMKKKIFEMPSTPAMRAMRRKVRDQLNLVVFSEDSGWRVLLIP
jgi:hypothetical protein